jgi:hypothetical protein
MYGGVGRQFKAAALLLVVSAFLLAMFIGTTADRASARASLRAYMTTGPNTWEPMGFNVTGTAARFVVDNMGWNVSKTFGNVGIGDGSVRALNTLSNKDDINYTNNNFIAGDVTTAPWDLTRIKKFSEPEVNITEYNNTTSASKGEQEENTTSKVSFGEISGNIALNDPFHSILVGRPVDDLLYEHPHAISANMYSRLVGLRMPGGAYANVGMRTIGYGF